MIDIIKKGNIISLVDGNKSSINFDTTTNDVFIDDLNVVHAGEFEKSGILLEVKEYDNTLFYSFTIDSKQVVIITSDTFELKEEILSFFGDVDILVIFGSKEGAKIFENIEARVVVPYGDGRSTFLTTLGQHTEEVTSFKVKGEFAIDATEFVNLV